MSLFADINKVELMGNVTKDPELRYTAGGTAVCSISLATNRSYKQGEEWKTQTEFHNIVLWAKLAESANERLVKGTKILITGRLETQKWEDKNGNTKYRTQIVADDMILIDRYNKQEKTQEQSVEEVFEDMEEPKEDEQIDMDDLPF